MDYEQYIRKFDSDSEDDDDPVIKQLKYNALFAEEDGFIIILPDFKPFRYKIEPVPPPPNPRGSEEALKQHDQIVGSMKAMTLTMYDKAGKSYSSSESLSAQQSPPCYTRKQQRSDVSDTQRHSPKCKKSRELQQTCEKPNKDCKKKINRNNTMKIAGKFVPRNKNLIDATNGARIEN